MKKWTLIILVILIKALSAQVTEPYIDTLIKHQMKYHQMECQVWVVVEVPGIDIPDKQVFIRLMEGEKPKIKSKGLLFFPKKGLYGQMDQLFEGAYQPILTKKHADSLTYKLVSLEEKSDWITADISFTYHDYRIHQLIINTRDNGQFFIYHSYDEMGVPKSSRIEFDITNARLPLKFLGRQNKSLELDSLQISKGKVYLEYQDFKFLEKENK